MTNAWQLQMITESASAETSGRSTDVCDRLRQLLLKSLVDTSAITSAGEHAVQPVSRIVDFPDEWGLLTAVRVNTTLVRVRQADGSLAPALGNTVIELNDSELVVPETGHGDYCLDGTVHPAYAADIALLDPQSAASPTLRAEAA